MTKKCNTCGLLIHEPRWCTCIYKELCKPRITKEQFEKLAAIEHEQWIYWTKNLAKKTKINVDNLPELDAWKLLWKPYSELTEEIKEHDRRWAREAIKAMGLEVID